MGDTQSWDAPEPLDIQAVVEVIEPGVGIPHSRKEALHALFRPERERKGVIERAQKRPGDVGAFLD